MAEINIGEQVKQIAIKYAEVLKKEYIIHGLYLYGSYAKGNYNSDSDIDIAIIADGLSGDKS
jgi:uncharacterized protein